MIKFTTTILKFDEQGEKTGWTYIEIPAEVSQQIKPNNKQSFRIKGKLDGHKISGIALMPMGNKNFIMAINAAMRKAIGKRKGAMLFVQIEADNSTQKINKELLECLNDEPKSLERFNKLPPSHQHYYSRWIESAKTEPTKAKRIAMAVSALSRAIDFGAMIRENKAKKML